MSEQNVVPFGKYKGQPLEAMAADQGYVDWLMGQSWFKDRHPNIYTLIVNNFTEPSETPEHNALQVLFLDDDFVERVVSSCYGDTIAKEVRSWEKAYSNNEIQKRLIVKFEIRGADVWVQMQVCPEGRHWYDVQGGKFIIEIKPAVGDDYPAVLRQIRNIRCNGRPILFLESYTGAGVTKGQFVEMFLRSGVKVVFRGDL